MTDAIVYYAFEGEAPGEAPGEGEDQGETTRVVMSITALRMCCHTQIYTEP